ncbi:MAG: TonB-dependent receptor [Verrucomicrobiota bacterium]
MQAAVFLGSEESFTQELRANYSGDQANGVMGLYFFDIESENSGLGTFFGMPFASVGAQDVRNYAVFGELEYQFGENWTVIAGSRYDYEERENGSQFTFTEELPTPTITDTSYSAFLPKLAVVYNWSEDMSTGFTIQKGYRAGGSSQNAGGDISEWDPEFTTNYELSHRSVLLENKLSANANIFFTQWKDMISSINPRDPVTGDIDFLRSFTTNASEAEYYGAELELRYQASDWISMFTSIGYLQSEFTDFVTNETVYTGNEFPDSPEWSGSMGADLEFDNGIFGDLVVSYSEASFNDQSNDLNFSAESHVLVDLSLGYRKEWWSFRLYARNLFDRDFVTGRRTATTIFVNEPRVLGASFSASY